MSTLGLAPEDYKVFEDVVLVPLKKLGFKVYLFGSRAQGKHKQFSDIDLLLEAPSSFDQAAFSLIKENIEEARFPVKVDFVLSADLVESYRDSIDAVKIKL